MTNTLGAHTVLPGRPTPGTGAEGQLDSLNLMFIVGFAILISVLARFLARRGGRRK